MDSPEPPQPANIAQANVSGVAADAGTLALRQRIERASRLGLPVTYDLPQFNDQGVITGYTPQSADFSGLGDAEIQAMQQRQYVDLAQSMAPELLDLQRMYGTQFVEEQRRQQEASDPEAFRLRQELGNQLLGELASGGDLTSEQSRNVEQGVRMAQQARGNLFSPESAVKEALGKFDVGEQLKQRRQANAQAFVFGQPLASYNVAAAQQGASPVNPVGFGQGYVNQLNPNAGQQGQNYALGVFDVQSQNYRAQMQQPNPFMTFGGTLLGVGGQLGAAAISSILVKENVKPFANGFDMLRSLKVKRYDYKSGFGGKNRIGLIAEECPDEVRAKIGEINAVDLYSLLSIAISAIQELSEKVEAMEARQ